MARINLQDTNNTFIITDNKEVTDMKLNMKDFANAIATTINNIQDTYKAEVAEVVKMNDEILYGVQMKQDGENAAPTLYANHAYRAYEDGVFTVEAIAEQFIQQAECVPMPGSLPTAEFDFSLPNIQDKLSVRLIGLERNQRFREHTPISDIGNGLGLIADVNYSDEYRTTVNYKILEMVGCNEDELFKAALHSAEKYDPAVFKSMTTALFGDGADNILNKDCFEWDDDGGMYVLTTESGCFGASAMCYDGVLEKIGELFRVGFYILPSSVHEVIILPDTGSHSAKDLRRMVHDANRSVVDDKDILSDEVYYYSYQWNELSIAA